MYILGRRAESLQKTADAAVNGKIVPIVADVSSQESLASAAAQVRSREGLVDILIANSGILGPTLYGLFPVNEASLPSIGDVQKRLWDISMDDFTQTMHVNVTGAFYTVVAFLDLLDAANHQPPTSPPRPKSQAIIVTSIAGLSRVPSTGVAYSASKAAATHMTKQLATSFAPYKIRINAIAPGYFLTEMTNDMPISHGIPNPRVEGSLASKVCPLERSGTEEEIGALALYLASCAGAYVNGCVQVIDGGRVGAMPASY